MRRSLLVLALLSFTVILSATNYYSYAPTGNDITNLNHWWTGTNGSGSHPSSFDEDGAVYYVQSGHNMTASSEWDVNGSGSKAVIQGGGKITTGAFNHDILLDIDANGTYEVTHTTYGSLDFGTLSSSSNFILNNGSIIFQDDESYGNLILRNGTADVFGTSTFYINGTLTIESGGIFEGGQSSNHSIYVANIVLDGGSFYGCTGSATIVFNISGDITVNSGYFRASDGSGGVTYNVSGSVTVNSGWFYACFRASSGDLPTTTWNINGSFRNNGNYYARNRAEGGYPNFNFTGGGLIMFNNGSNAVQGQHMINIATGTSYQLYGSNTYLDQYFSLNIYGTLSMGTLSIRKYSGDPYAHVYGTVKTGHLSGLVNSSSAAFIFDSTGSLILHSGCTVDYNNTNSGAVQVVTPLSTYQNLMFEGPGSKTLDGDATVAGTITMQSTLNIYSGRTLTLNGPMTGGVQIIGSGNILISGSAATLNLVQTTCNQLTVNRANGCTLAGNLALNNLILTLGTLTLSSYTMTISGSIAYSGGTLSGTSSSTIEVSGSASQLSLAGITLRTLSVNRSNGCLLTGTLNIHYALNLSLGQLDLGTNTIYLYGMVTKTGGTLNAANGTFRVESGSYDVTLPFTVASGVVMNRTGWNCYMSGSSEFGIFAVTAGTFHIGANNTLTVNNYCNIASYFVGGTTSSFFLRTVANIPANLVLHFFYHYASGTSYLMGSLTANNVILNSGILNLVTHSLTVNQSISAATGSITGSNSSTIYLNGASASPLNMPPFNIGKLYLNRDGTVNITSTSSLQASLHLIRGILYIAAKANLDLLPNATIYRSEGSIIGSPTFQDAVNVVYEADLTTGPEIPSELDILQNLHIMMDLVITAGSDIPVCSELMIDDFSRLELGDNILYLQPEASVGGGMEAFVFGRAEQDRSLEGYFDSLPIGLSIDPGIPITGFAVTHLEEIQILPMGSSVNRTWTLEGDFDGEKTVTFIWPASADNGLDFDSQPAVVMVNEGSGWRAYSEPTWVSGDPRMITFNSDHFSQWTVTTEDQSLPVELSSFTAVPAQQGYVLLKWVTQSESGLMGFRFLRGQTDSAEEALDLNHLISATNTSNQQEYAFLDEEIDAPGIYYYWLQSVELSGQGSLHGPAYVTVTAEPDGTETPEISDNVLLRAYPNPFYRNLYLQINHKADGILAIGLYDVSGRRVATLWDDYCRKGVRRFTWNGRDREGNACASGVYLIRCRSGKEITTQKTIMLK